ncbi:MAG: DUF4116 domain-containing protein [Clostridia bacterium]|nr:DUF4116 domain-containing protein [Clostridia bacterium]
MEESNKQNKIKTKEDALRLVNRLGNKLYRLSAKWRDDEDVVLEAVKSYPLALEYASARLKKNKQIVLEAVKGNPRALSFADETIYDDDNWREYAFGLYGSAFIVNPDAWAEFEFQDAQMIKNTRAPIGRDTLKAIWETGGCYHFCDENLLNKNEFYKTFEKYYFDETIDPLKPSEIRFYERWLLAKRALRLKYVYNKSEKNIEDDELVKG